jgi:hypothetical protein
VTIEDDGGAYRFRGGDSDVNIARMKFRQIERQTASGIDDDSLTICGLAAYPSMQADPERCESKILCCKADCSEPGGRVD